MKKYITIEWDDKDIRVDHSGEIGTQELLGVIEIVKFKIWEKSTPISEAKDNVLLEPTKRSEMRIGETREFDGAIYRCVAANGRDCEGCAFFNEDDSCDLPLGECLDERREDKTTVMFEKEE